MTIMWKFPLKKFDNFYKGNFKQPTNFKHQIPNSNDWNLVFFIWNLILRNIQIFMCLQRDFPFRILHNIIYN
jgi:hypothetical protein